MSSSVNVTAKAFTASSRYAALVAPIIGELTPFAHCHASAVIHSGLPLFPQSEFRSQNGE